ncbi:hypothetical protein [Variovorax terrae]|uniref:Uncharacterized protein n=1 Tax=Variovorax terrae TaxID=2923278 RepID=A0A9X2ARF3_9BURK|nr:hypothetical protein [Variovorax terrae]MCJ0764166.1 hypothetical protein [Variovorax terrae]
MPVALDDIPVIRTPNPPVCSFLPPDARAALVRAANTPIDGDPMARVKAIEAVTARVKLLHSEFFQAPPLEE